MQLSASNASAVHKIAELVGSNEPARSRLERILTVTREALGIDTLSLVAKTSITDEVATWHSAVENKSFDPAVITSKALDVISGNEQNSPSSDQFIIPLLSSDTYQAVLVGCGATDGESESPLLSIISGFISLLIENEKLAQAQESSNRIDHKRIEDIAALYEIGQAVDATNVDPLLDKIVAKAAEVMDAQACSLMLKNPTDGTLEIAASCGLTDDIVKGAKINFGEGIAGQVAQTGEPMLISDVSADPRFTRAVKPRAGISGSMCVPLKDEDGFVQGVISIRRHEPKQTFNQDDLKLFCVFATHAALALSNAQLYTRLHRKVQEMSTISDVLRAINSTLDLDHVLDQIVDSIADVVGFDRCCVYLLDSRTNEFIAGARRGYDNSHKLKDRIRIGEGVIGLAAKELIPIFSQGSPVESDTEGLTGEFLAAPIVVRDSCTGVVVVDNCISKRQIEPQHVELLATFVSQAGIAVENARLYEAMEEKYAELNVLYEHSKSISTAYGLDNVANMLVNTASRAVKCDGAGLLLLDTRRGHLKLQASFGGMLRIAPEVERLAKETQYVDFVREQRSPVLLSADSADRTNGLNAELLNTLAPNKSNLLFAPLVVEDTTIGILSLYRNKQEEFQGSEFKLISIITSHAAMVMKNAISYEQKMRQRVLELTAIYEFSKKISSAATLEEALDSILAIVADLVDYDESFIYAIDHDNEIAVVKAARFRGKQDTIPPDEPLDGNSVTSWAINEHKALISPDISRDSRFSAPGIINHNIRSMMSIPLIVQDEVVGVLSVHSNSPKQYSEDDVRVLSIIASQGAAIYKELEALSALTSYTDNILSSIAAGVVVLDPDGIVLTWNNAAEEIVGAPREEVVLQHFEDGLGALSISQNDRNILKRAINGVQETGETFQGYKLCFHPKNDEELYMNMSISQLLNSAGEQLGLVIIFEDITREIKMENEFRRMGELAAIGQLAASIAHELRNPLSSIKGAAQFLQKEYEDHGSIVEFLEIIIEEVNGLNGLTTEFLDFARPMQLELKPTKLNEVIERTLQLMSVHITDNNVVVKQAINPDIPEIQADGKQLQQVLKNIIINALQAMPEGGVITVETGPTPSGGAYMSISDTGIGIPVEKFERIFQPFITTKTKGTGLGLSVVHKIVENHGGKIEVASEVGRGATFTIRLPKTGFQAPITTEFDSTMDRRVSGELKSGDAK